MSCFLVFFTLGLFWDASGQLLPLTTKQDGSVDMSILVNHITRLEQNLQTTKAELERTNSRLQDQQKQSITMNDTINNQLQTIKSDLALKTKTVAFSAGLFSSTGYRRTMISNQSITFDHVQYDAGNGYNRSTGRFTAPVSGTYTFSTQILMFFSKDQHFVYLDIMKSGSLMASSYAMSSTYVTIPVTTVMYVGQGEEVWVQSNDTVIIYEDWTYGSYFVGALVSAY